MSSKVFLPLAGAVLLLTSAVPVFASFSQTPEPGTFVLMGGGIGALFVVRYLKNRKHRNK